MKVLTNSLLIVAPYQDEAAFLETMSNRLNADVELLNYKTNIAVSRSVWRRHAIILLMAYRAFQKSKDKDFILFGEQFVGLYYAFFNRLFFWARRPACGMVLQLIYNKKPGWKGLVYGRIFRWLIKSPALNYLVCHASVEQAFYQKEFGEEIGKKISFVPFGRNKPATPVITLAVAEQRYFFSGGTSNRDYATLIEAFKGIGASLVIACHPNDIKGITVPKNVRVHHDVFGSAFQDYIDQAFAVILPILSTDVSAGQLVLIDAMRSSKASIVTGGSCMEDYVDPSCAVSVRHKNVQDLREAVQFLDTNPEVCKRLGDAALIRYKNEFTRRAFAERLCNVVLNADIHATSNVSRLVA